MPKSGRAMAQESALMGGSDGEPAHAEVNRATSATTAFMTSAPPEGSSIRSLAAHCRPVHLVVGAAVVAADAGAAAGDPDQPADEGRAVDAVHGEGHVVEAAPLVGSRIVVVMVGEHAGR